MSFEYEDVGVEHNPEDDYPEFALKVAKSIIDQEDRGIVICGSGVGWTKSPTKFPNPLRFGY